MDEYFGVAKEKGIQQKEIDTVLSIVMAVSGCRVRAQFRHAREQGAARRKNTARR